MASATLASPQGAAQSADGLVGSSLQQVLDSVRIVAPTDSTVLIQGETGTGKELVANAIHLESMRRLGPYVKVNCAAIPAGLIESQLFGHERGAFTGACLQTAGRFELAHRGTLFLDEVGDMPIELQPKLLRVLQEREFERVGGNRPIRVDVRVVAATNQDLLKLVQERRFRADLYYRINVFPITLPPLRERPDDIPLLATHFLRKFAKRMNKEVKHIPEESMTLLRRHDWPGNIRELQNVVERAVILSSGSILCLPHFELKHPVNSNTPSPMRTLAEAEREHIGAVLHHTRGVVGGRNGAAARLGIARATLLHRMQKLGITAL
jgi:formate hydrogenlyase transcriptional activator